MHNKAFLFDLDGTLIDTAPDFLATINDVRNLRNLAPLALVDILSAVNLGANAMTALAFSTTENDHKFQDYKREFLEKYTDNIGKYSSLYAGMHELLLCFKQHGRLWGIATNKPRKYAEKYISLLPAPPTVLLCGDDVEKAKPDPSMLLEASKHLGLSPDNIGYAGDHERDITAANSAGMYSIAATYGYLSPLENPSTWQADMLVQSSEALSQFIYSFTDIPSQG